MYLPSPLDIDDVAGVDMHDAEVAMTRPARDSEPFSALAFKIATDPFVGSITFCRIYSGEWLCSVAVLLLGVITCAACVVCGMGSWAGTGRTHRAFSGNLSSMCAAQQPLCAQPVACC